MSLMTDQGDLFESRNRAQQIFEKFKKFHAVNPQIWTLFKKYSFQMHNAGRQQYGAAAIFERIRWHVGIETKSNDDLKLCNDFRAYYGRMFNACFFELFAVRKLRSQDRPPNDSTDIWIDPAPDPARERDLLEELKRLGK